MTFNIIASIFLLFNTLIMINYYYQKINLGWGIPYEYNNGDLTACILFLEKHLYNGTISWPTFQYMVRI
jgi:hypothetical protein